MSEDDQLVFVDDVLELWEITSGARWTPDSGWGCPDDFVNLSNDTLERV